MNASPFRNVILPALLTSSATFAALTLPVASTQTNRIVTRLPAPVQQWVAISGSHQQEGLSIRYIGFAILTSTVLGIGTAELLRTKQIRDGRRQALLRQAMSDSFQDANSPWVEAPFPIVNGAPLAAGGEVDGAAETPGPRGMNAAFETSGSLADDPLDWEALNSGTLFSTETVPAANGGETCILPEANYRTCRIRTVADRRLTAICIEGEFYSFYRIGKDLDRTQAILDKLLRTGKNAVATPDQGGYAVWLHQPGAELDTSDWQPPIALGNQVLP